VTKTKKQYATNDISPDYLFYFKTALMLAYV